MDQSSRITVSFGSNFGDRKKNVGNALRWFGSVAQECVLSSIYETPEIHGIGTPYMNAVATGVIKGDIEEVISMTKIFEKENGRDSDRRAKGEVPIDIDIVMRDSEILRPQDFSREFFQIGFREVTGRT